MTVLPTGSTDPEPAGRDLDDQTQAARGLVRGIIIGIVVAPPVCVAVLVGLVFLGVRDTGTALVPPLAMAAAVGVLTGLFFGSWAGFVSNTHAFEELDRTALRRRTSSPSHDRDH